MCIRTTCKEIGMIIYISIISIVDIGFAFQLNRDCLLMNIFCFPFDIQLFIYLFAYSKYLINIINNPREIS